MNTAARIATAILLLATAAFCGFGFMATFEPLDRGTQLFWRIVYGLVGLACLAQILWLARAKKT